MDNFSEVIHCLNGKPRPHQNRPVVWQFFVFLANNILRAAKCRFIADYFCWRNAILRRVRRIIHTRAWLKQIGPNRKWNLTHNERRKEFTRERKRERECWFCCATCAKMIESERLCEQFFRRSECTVQRIRFSGLSHRRTVCPFSSHTKRCLLRDCT